MTYRGVVKGNVVELEDHVALPQGTRVFVIPEAPAAGHARTLRGWLKEARRVRKGLPETSDSVEIVRRLRKERSGQ